jgi:hypothetical protein
MGLLPCLELSTSFHGLQFVEKVKASVELRNVQDLGGSLLGG